VKSNKFDCKKSLQMENQGAPPAFEVRKKLMMLQLEEVTLVVCWQIALLESLGIMLCFQFVVSCRWKKCDKFGAYYVVGSNDYYFLFKMSGFSNIDCDIFLIFIIHPWF